jgi:hypothetical protein
MNIICSYCGEKTTAQRKTKKYCSNTCASRHRRGFPKERKCKLCGNPFKLITRADANRQYCSQKCSKKANTKRIMDWNTKHLKERKQMYYENQKQKNPTIWQDKHRSERLEAIRLLGGKCVVCGVTNPNWLHLDYIPTTRGKSYRHPRHLAYIREHTNEFRLLCANHHYELTLTGRIEGSEITQ